MKIRVRNQSMLLLYGIAVFILNSICRGSISEGTGLSLTGMLGSVNLLAIIAVVFIAANACNGGKISSADFNIVFLLITLLYAAAVIYSNLTGVSSSRHLGNWVLAASILPGMILCSLNLNKKIDFEVLLRKITTVLNVVFLPTFVIGIADYFMGGVINNFIADCLSSESWANMIRTEMAAYGFRMITIFGSPLMNAFYMLVVLAFNAIYRILYKKYIVNTWLVYGICMIAIFLTGSRTALVLGVALILFTELMGKWRLVKILVLVVLFALLIQTPIFQQTVGARLKIGFMNSYDARYNLLVSFMNGDYGIIRFFSGGGYNYSRELTATAANSALNFEYPILMFLFDYGIFATVLYYLLYFLYPVIVMLKNKQYYMLVVFGILFVFLQTNNVTAQYYDFNLQLGFIITLFAGIAENIKNEEKCAVCTQESMSEEESNA